ncbi:hypothetical protein SOCEGT47_069320 [Sorangium cellulosum]|uniref:Uncharacterized protein n=1 Tax=Sorangium cellulosum TaxID=56 RepID=A0A4P2QAP9_SORCE|nr:hypothetical protein [Sorangium cellulosum]AUX26371.1 hypothetical protein SOCEGT47_069320 [Sorangium cellulosum]
MLAGLAALAGACGPKEAVAPRPAAAAPPREAARVAHSGARREDLRLIPAEAYLRTYLRLFGGLTLAEAERRARGNDGAALFDAWQDYLAALGLPDYRLDLPRATQTNALMLAAFERLGIALCDRALEHDLKAKERVPIERRFIFAFDLPGQELDEAAFAPRFDVLHRTFLSYPARLAPPDREEKFFALYAGTVTRHRAKGAARSRFSPAEAGWAAVCYGLVRHPEFHLY